MNLELRVEDETPTNLTAELVNGIPLIIPAIDSIRITSRSSERNKRCSIEEAEARLSTLLSQATKEAALLYGEPALVAAEDIDTVVTRERHHLILSRRRLYQNIGREFIDFSKKAAKDELLLRVTHRPFFLAGCYNLSEPGIYLYRFGNKFETQHLGRSFPKYQSAVAAFTLTYSEPLWLASHELGHNFGLRHHGTDDPNCIMAFNADTYCGPCKNKIMEVKEKGSFSEITLRRADS